MTVALATLSAGCSARGAGGAGSTPAPPETRGSTDVEALFRARADSARMRFTEADARFVAGMIEHHAQALEMAALVRTRTQNPTLHRLAERIANGQEAEIEAMRTWLEDRGRPVPNLVMGSSHQHMPGMLTPAQMAELAAASGEAFDRLFLTFMIQHHEGAVVMVRELFDTDGALQEESLFRLASDIQVDQITEITRMEQMLATLTAPTN